MTTNVTTTNPVRSDVTHTVPGPTTTHRSRGWALAGIAAGLGGIGTIVTSSMANAVYDEDLVGNSAAVAEKLHDQTTAMFAFHSVATLTAILVAVFGVGLFRRLRDAVSRDSMAPMLAFGGLLGTSVVLVLGAGLDTEFMLSFTSDTDKVAVDPANAALYNHWVGTIPWCWVLAGLAGVALFAASRLGGVPRWIGRAGLVLGALAMVAGISPFEYMAAIPGALMLLVTGIGFAVGDKAHRGA
jgi:hypothetical protein